MIFGKHMARLQQDMADANIDIALITDDDAIYYFTGYYDYLHMEFGRPTILVVSSSHPNILITPAMEQHMAKAAAKVDQMIFWNDGMGDEWREALPDLLNAADTVGYEPNQMPPIVQNYVKSNVNEGQLRDIEPMIANIRMIKTAEELQLARHAGQVANAMMQAGRDAIGDGVAEFEVALATSAAGTRKAAELLGLHYPDAQMSPNTHFLQIMASGAEISKPHHRASTRRMQIGEPVFLCFCGMTNFHRFKLGFDRTFWIGEIAAPIQAEVYQLAVDSQAAALEMLRPGVAAQDIHAAYAKVIQQAGYDYPFRCGRATGFSFLEKPQIVFGDETEIRPGMVLAIDGSITYDSSFRAQVGDSFIVTEDGYEAITAHSKALADMIL